MEWIWLQGRVMRALKVQPPILLVWLWPLMYSGVAIAQSENVVGDVDTLFVQDLSHMLTGRIYSSTKYNDMAIRSQNGGRSLIYRPTNQYNIGIGASYRKFTLNLGVGIPYLTYQRRQRLGRSRYLDAQANIFSAERATNLFLQFWQGYRLIGAADPEAAFRDDIEQFNFGASTLRVFNSERFSYRAPMFHDAWQRRSQGSWLLGGSFTYYRLRADSALVPAAEAADHAAGAAFVRADLFDLGPMGGYAHSFVIDERFYVMGSVVAGAGASMRYAETDPPGNEAPGRSGTSWGPAFRAQLRGGIGYSDRRQQISLTFNHENIHYLLGGGGMFAWSVGNIRLNIVHRFDHPIRAVDALLRKLKPRTHPFIHEAIPAIKEAEEE